LTQAILRIENGGVKEIIKDGVTGFLVPPKSPEKIAENIIHLFENPKLLDELGSNAKKYVREKFTMQNYIKSIEEIIFSI